MPRKLCLYMMRGIRLSLCFMLWLTWTAGGLPVLGAHLAVNVPKPRAGHADRREGVVGGADACPGVLRAVGAEVGAKGLEVVPWDIPKDR